MQSKLKTYSKSIVLVISLVTSSCYNAQRNCSHFKTGTFEFEYEINHQKIREKFTRNDTLEISFSKAKPDSATVRWINDCEYILQKINPKSIHEKKAIHIKILTTDSNGYNFEYKYVGTTQKQKGYVTKIK
jgi:hypothetical protein